jgi:hypothetical protein
MCSKNAFPKSSYEKNWFFRFPNLKGLKFGDSQSNSQKISISGLKLPFYNNYKPTFIRFGTFFRKFDESNGKEKSIKFFTKKITIKKKKKLNINYFIKYFNYFKNFIKILKKAFLKIFIYKFFKNSCIKEKSEKIDLNIIHGDMNDKRRFYANKKITTNNKNLIKKVLHKLFSKKINALKMNTIMNLSHKIKINKEKHKIIKRKEKFKKHKTNLNPIISKNNLNGLKRKINMSKNKIFFPISNKLDKMIKKKKNISTCSSKKKFFGMKTHYFLFNKKSLPNNFSKLIFNKNNLFIHIENNNNKQKWLIFFKKICLKFLKKNNRNRNPNKNINSRKLKYLGLIENSKNQPAIDLDCPFTFLVCISNKSITINKIKGIIITKKFFKEKSTSNKNLDKKMNNAKKFVKNLILNIKAVENFEKKNFEYQNEDEFYLFLKNTYFYYDINFKNFKKYVKILGEDNLIINLLKKKNSKSRSKLMTLKNPNEEFSFLKKSKFLSELITKFFKWKNLEEKNHDFLNLLEIPEKVKIILNLKKVSYFKKHYRKKKNMKNEKKNLYPKNHNKKISILKGCLKKKKKELKYKNLKKKDLIKKFSLLPFRLKFNLKTHDKLEKTIRELETIAIFLKSFNGIEPKPYKYENINYNNSMDTTVLDLIQGSPSKKYSKRFPILTKNYDSIDRIGYCIEFQQNQSIFFLSQNINFSDIIRIKTEMKPKSKVCKINICHEQNCKILDFGFLHYVFSNLKKNKLIKKTTVKQMMNFKNNIKLEKLIDRIGNFKKKSPIFDFCKYNKKYF